MMHPCSLICTSSPVCVTFHGCLARGPTRSDKSSRTVYRMQTRRGDKMRPILFGDRAGPQRTSDNDSSGQQGRFLPRVFRGTEGADKKTVETDYLAVVLAAGKVRVFHVGYLHSPPTNGSYLSRRRSRLKQGQTEQQRRTTKHFSHLLHLLSGMLHLYISLVYFTLQPNCRRQACSSLKLTCDSTS